MLGELEAKALRLEMTMLFVFENARVEQAILFETNDGTLSVAKRTICPLVICHEGDLNIAASGEVLDSTDDGPFDGDATGESDDGGGGFPSPRVTMTLAEAREKLVPAVFDDDELDSDKVYRRAAKGQSVLRPVKTPKAAPKVAEKLAAVPIREADKVTSLVSDGEHLWMGARGMLMFDGKRFTRMWRNDPKGQCDGPPATPAGLVFALVGRELVVSGSAHPAFDAMLQRGFGATSIPIATSDDLGVTWQELVPPTKSGLVAPVSDGVAMFRSAHTLSCASSLAGPWRDVRIVPEGTPAMTAHSIASVGNDVWVALGDGKRGAVYVVSGDAVRQCDYGSKSPVRRILATHDGGVLLLGDAGLALLTTDGGRTFAKSTHAADGDIADATRVGDAIYAVGGLPLSKKGPKGNVGFLMRSIDGGRTFEMLANDIAGRMWAVTAHRDRLFLAGAAATAFTYALA